VKIRIQWAREFHALLGRLRPFPGSSGGRVHLAPPDASTLTRNVVVSTAAAMKLNMIVVIATSGCRVLLEIRPNRRPSRAKDRAAQHSPREAPSGPMPATGSQANHRDAEAANGRLTLAPDVEHPWRFEKRLANGKARELKFGLA